jgi:hypothetical protein
MFAGGASLAQVEYNPFLEEICQAGRLSKLDFVINALYNSKEEVKEIIAGDFEKVHTAGASMTLSEPAVRFEEPADVTVTSAFPSFLFGLELITKQAAREITQAVTIPTNGIGAGPDCDGQALNLYDVIGLTVNFEAKFVKRYADVRTIVEDAVKRFYQGSGKWEFS